MRSEKYHKMMRKVKNSNADQVVRQRDEESMARKVARQTTEATPNRARQGRVKSPSGELPPKDMYYRGDGYHG